MMPVRGHPGLRPNSNSTHQVVRARANPRPPSTWPSSLLMCAGLVVTYSLLPDTGAIAIFRAAAIGASLAIGVGFWMEVKDVRSLFRTDVLMIVSLFGLTLVEFFFPQEVIKGMVSSKAALQGVQALFLGFSGLIIGRNFGPKSKASLGVGAVKISARTQFSLFIVLFFIGYLNMLVAVDFNIIELVNQMMQPRFTQSWSRGSLGGWNVLLGEFSGLLLYLVPALAGAIFASASQYGFGQKAFVIFGLVFTLFYGFSSGTRNVFAIYLVLFVATYVLLRPRISWRVVTIICTIVAALLYFAAYYMLQFRTVGLENYIEYGGAAGGGFREETLFIDNNLPVISLLTEVFPRSIPFLGSEFASYAILHPVPRAIWPSKPEHLSVEPAEALGLSGVTISSTFVGEAYMMGGYVAVVAVGLLLGWLAGWWNRFGSNLDSNVSVALYASGFFAALLSMRSIVWTTTAMLPTVAIWLYARSRKV